MKLSKIAQTIPVSPIRTLVPFAMKAKEEGKHIYHLNIGDPDVKTPEIMLDVLRNWSRNPISYENSHGSQKLLKNLLGYYHKLGFTDLTIKNIQITVGGSEGLLWTILSVCNPGDEVIVFEPFYANYNGYATIAHITNVPVQTTIDNGFHLPDRSVIEEKITDKTKAILFSNPSNPSGTVYTREELDMLLDIAKKHNLYIISDEVYREYVYEGRKAISMLEYANEYKDGIIVADSFSKRYSLCGARLGMLVSYNEELMGAFLRLGQARLSAGLIEQEMAAKLDKLDASYFKEVNAEYDRRRKVLVEGMRSIPDVVCSEPEGAFYVIAKLPVKDTNDFAKWLLTDFSDNNETVMVAPAAGFYATEGLGIDEVRIAYVLNVDSLKRSVEILKKALDKYDG